MTTTNQSTTQDAITLGVASNEFAQTLGYGIEDAVLDAMDLERGVSVSSAIEASLTLEIAPLSTMKQWISSCRVQLARDMALGLVSSAIHAYDTGDLDSLGQAIVDWSSTLEVEADKNLFRRVQRRLEKQARVNDTAI